MPRQPILPPADVIQELRDAGWRLKDIAAQYEVSPSAVQKALHRAGYADTLATYRDVVPWIVDPRLSDTAVVQRLRTMGHVLRKEPVDPVHMRLLDQWLRDMETHGVVLDYHPDAPANDACSLGGFFYRTRVPEDAGFYREPAVNKMLGHRAAV